MHTPGGVCGGGSGQMKDVSSRWRQRQIERHTNGTAEGEWKVVTPPIEVVILG